MTTGEDAIMGEAGERYARALFELAESQDALDAVEADLAALGAALTESVDLRRALASPLHRAEDKAKALKALGEKLGFQALTANFVQVVARNGRAADLADMVKAFKALAAKKRGSTSAEVASADKLTAAQLKELAAALKTALGRDVEIRTEVRPELIGGLVVKVGSRMFDSSLRTKLEGMRSAMKEA